MKTLVAVGIPSGDMVHTDFAMSLAMLCMNSASQVFLLNSRSSLVPVGRNQCAAAAQVMKASHLLFLDTDMIFPDDALTRLLARDKDVVGATYSKRVPPFDALTIAEDGRRAEVGPGLHKVAVIPTGCLLIKLSVFNALPKPFFGLASEGGELLGEEHLFCAQVRRAGFEIYCDGDLSKQIGHIGQKIYRTGEVEAR